MSEFIPWFPTGTPHEERVVHVRELAARTGVAIVGCLYCIGGRSEDESRGFHNLELEEQDFLDILRRRIRQDKDYGCEYGTFQLHLPSEHLSTGGLYRGDEEFLDLTAQRIADIQAVCFAEGLNCYFETHIDKVSEDIQAFADIIHRAPHFEVTGDLSHYIYRGIIKGQGLEVVLARVGHMHQRMARAHGDLSADVKDGQTWAEDWDNAEGVTRLAWNMAVRAIGPGGLSSRCIMGETGELALVGGRRTLDLDTELIPFYQALARHADNV